MTLPEGPSNATTSPLSACSPQYKRDLDSPSLTAPTKVSVAGGPISGDMGDPEEPAPAPLTSSPW
eukprot:CAMPEP_0204288242 /NCGR_PEP_ID=MMETSP0468-20130131/56384_1 /ASSEMBLY_ACC=CAM_ASM_000383 /TAXON_ID=2969 /ORGANISM="Oxyrrhis marina" /LENGTH=64 /DNA_ID=CAMNT_0051266317 /DNA_START=243 /DNA_END=437 /DNA_ORIENTATION=+